MRNDSCFLPLPSTNIPLPDAFPYPFCYQVDELARLAALDLQNKLNNKVNWQHNFGMVDGKLIGNAPHLLPIGKMFGVLVVKNKQGEVGYLSAFSGKLAESNHIAPFVPPIFDTLETHGHFLATTDTINDINEHIEKLETSEQYQQALQAPIDIEKEAEQAINHAQQQMREEKAKRKQARREAEQTLQGEQLEQCLHTLAKQSIDNKNHLKQLKQHWQDKIRQTEQTSVSLMTELSDLKEKRKALSHQLQHWLFSQYQLRSNNGKTKDLNAIFAPNLPPAGAGECAAPKLFQHAFLHGYTPITMAEFWCGASPSAQLRRHQHFYPACQHKCQPILDFMLDDMIIDDNPLLQNPAQHKTFEILYQDDAIIVVNKPADFLSVPGVHIKDSIYTRLQAQFTGENLFVLHRLDMATSGVLVFARTPRANKQLQKQFIERQIQKRYIAIIAGRLDNQTQGEVSLPLIGDIEDRPRQKVCFKQGKPAHTHWQLIRYSEQKNCSKLYLYPSTGRTHQLRVHCAHPQGLNCPILGDDLYGQAQERLYLHAERLTLTHPYNKQSMTFIAPDPFV